MINGTAYVRVKTKVLTCADPKCAVRQSADDGGYWTAIGVFMAGEVTNLRCFRCRSQIKEAAALAQDEETEVLY
jgi:hypothetical protein